MHLHTHTHTHTHIYTHIFSTKFNMNLKFEITAQPYNTLFCGPICLVEFITA